jgi:hypothetical protein
MFLILKIKMKNWLSRNSETKDFKAGDYAERGVVMNNKLLLTIVLFLLIGCKIFAQIDTLNVYLEKNDKHKFGVNLVFENNSNDTIFLLTRFHNFSLGGEIPSYSGICIHFFHDGNLFNFNWGDMYDRVFTFSKGFILINPKSNVKLSFNIGTYFQFPEKSSNKYEVSFLMNYSFAKYRHSETTRYVEYFQTNRVTMVEPSGEIEITNQ